MTAPAACTFLSADVDGIGVERKVNLRQSEGIEIRRRPANRLFITHRDPVDIPTADWPCSLFKVEPAGSVSDQGAVVFSTRVRVIAEVPAHIMFGPQGRRVVELFDRYYQMGADNVDDLVAQSRFNASGPLVGAVAASIHRAGRWHAMKAITSALTADRTHRLRQEQFRRIDSLNLDAEERNARLFHEGEKVGRATVMAVSAAAAVMAQDVITDAAYDALTEPWFTAMGPV